MFLQKLNLINFKNYQSLECEFSAKVNCFVGDNGVGKSNLLDAIYYLSFCKSYFSQADSQNIRNNEFFFLIKGVYHKELQKDELYCGVKKGKKKVFKINSKDYTKLTEHIGYAPLVIISPQDSDIILLGSEDRRKFIDTVISQYNHAYLLNLVKYNRILLHRNQLLKKIAEEVNFNAEHLNIWDEQLILAGNQIFTERKKFVREFKPIFQYYYNYIADNKEVIDIQYKSHLNEESFETVLKENFEKDKILQYSTVGTHKDDLEFLIDSYPVKRRGSQGQQKTFLVALKLAQFDFMLKVSNVKPLLLLDDIFDKLDDLRVKRIIEMVSKDKFGQIFITDKNKYHLNDILQQITSDYKVFIINNGELDEIRNYEKG